MGVRMFGENEEKEIRENRKRFALFPDSYSKLQK